MAEVDPLPARGGFLTLAAVALVALAVGLWAWLGAPTEGGPVPTTGAGAVQPDGPSVGSAAPRFTVRLLEGGTFSLAEHLAGDGRPVLVNFWASWCIPCRAEMPALDAASARHPEVRFLGIATDDTETAARRFADEVAVGYPLAIDSTGTVAAGFGTFGLPTTYVIDGDGTVRGVAWGEVDGDQIDGLIADLNR